MNPDTQRHDLLEAGVPERNIHADIDVSRVAGIATPRGWRSVDAKLRHGNVLVTTFNRSCPLTCTFLSRRQHLRKGQCVYEDSQDRRSAIPAAPTAAPGCGSYSSAIAVNTCIRPKHEQATEYGPGFGTTPYRGIKSGNSTDRESRRTLPTIVEICVGFSWLALLWPIAVLVEPCREFVWNKPCQWRGI